MTLREILAPANEQPTEEVQSANLGDPEQLHCKSNRADRPNTQEIERVIVDLNARRAMRDSDSRTY